MRADGHSHRGPSSRVMRSPPGDDPLHARVPLYKTFLAPPPLRFEGSPRKPGVGAPNAAWGAGLEAQRRTSAAPKVEVRRGALTQSMILRPLLA